MEKCLRKSTAYGLERGFGPAAMIESAASVAGGGPQWAEGSQSLHYDPIGSMRNLTEKVKTEIPDKVSYRLANRPARMGDDPAVRLAMPGALTRQG